LRIYFETHVIRLGFGGLKVKVSVGMGCWAEIPWIGMRNPYLTDIFEEGFYVVYLLAPDYDATARAKFSLNRQNSVHIMK